MSNCTEKTEDLSLVSVFRFFCTGYCASGQKVIHLKKRHCFGSIQVFVLELNSEK